MTSPAWVAYLILEVAVVVEIGKKIGLGRLPSDPLPGTVRNSADGPSGTSAHTRDMTRARNRHEHNIIRRQSGNRRTTIGGVPDDSSDEHAAVNLT
jgi:hypothetical protein